jgi:uncharacterized protein (TIGR02118 family)
MPRSTSTPTNPEKHMRFVILATLALTLASCKPATPEPTWAVVVLYNQPKDTAAFEKYYWDTHVPLVGANQKEIGFVKAELVRFPSNLDGSTPAFYRKAELWFNSEDDMKKGLATPGFKKVADDLGNFATGGLTGLISTTAR